MKPGRARTANRIAIHALAWLLLGSAINYAQAVVFEWRWVGGVWARVGPGRVVETPESILVSSSAHRATAITDSARSSNRLDGVTYQGAIARTPWWVRFPKVANTTATSEGGILRYQTALGWPILATTGYIDSIITIEESPNAGWHSTPTMQRHEVSTGLLFPQSGSRSGNVPLIPLWPGFLLNALIWGFPVLLVPLVKSRRRARRERRGLCARCGYDLRSGSLTICPECGPPAPSGYNPHA